MRKVVLSVAVSLDNRIEGPNGEYDWCFSDQDYGMSDFFKKIDAIFFGRKSYEMMLTAQPEGGGGEDPFKNVKKYVFSNTLKKLESGFQIVSGKLTTQVNKIKKAEGKNIWLFGGAELTASFFEAGLIDEMALALHPIILGPGKPLFQGLSARKELSLLDSKKYDTGLVMLTYRVK